MDSLPQQQLHQAFTGTDIGGNARVHLGHSYNINQNTPNRPETPPSPLSTVPFPRDPDFVDRGSILSDIDKKLTVATRLALVGLGGVGKSQLAIEWSYRKRDESQNTWVLWIHASSAARFEQSMRNILDRLKVSGRNEPQADIFQLFRSWLYDARKGKWVVVIDNADDVSFLLEPPTALGRVEHGGTRERRLDYLPTCSHGSVLITSRSRAAALRMVEQNDIIDVGPMEEESALALLTKKLGQVNDHDEVVKLATELEYMPLAIVQAASFIRQRAPRLTVRQYIDKLAKNDKSRLSLLDRDEGDLRRDREARNSIILTWEISFEHIRTIRRTAADLLSLMSFFDRQAIQARLLKCRSLFQKDCTSSSSETGSGSRKCQPESGGGSPCEHPATSTSDDEDDESEYDEEFEDDLKLLRDYSFVSMTADVDVFEMHRLIQLATQRWLKANDAFEQWGLQFMSNLDDAFPEGDFKDWTICQSLFPHAMTALETTLVEEQAIVRQASVLLSSGSYAVEKGTYADAKKMLARSVALRKQVLGDEHYDTIISKTYLANAYRCLGRYAQAETLHVQHLALSKRVFGDDHDVTSRIKFNLALTHHHLGRYKEAEALELELLEWSRRVFGEEHSWTMMIRISLATTYNCLGRHEEAEDIRSKCLGCSKLMLGNEHPDTMMTNSILALTYQDLGRHKEAEDVLLEVLDWSKQVKGDEHPDTVKAKRNLATVYSDLGRHREAEELQLEAMECSERVLGNEHPATMLIRSDLAMTYANLGRLQESQELNSQALEWSQRVLGEKHPRTIMSMSNLAHTQWELGQRDVAIDLMMQAATLSSSVLGDDHPAYIYRFERVAERTKIRDEERECDDEWESEWESTDEDEGAESGTATTGTY